MFTQFTLTLSHVQEQKLYFSLTSVGFEGDVDICQSHNARCILRATRRLRSCSRLTLSCIACCSAAQPAKAVVPVRLLCTELLLSDR